MADPYKLMLDTNARVKINDNVLTGMREDINNREARGKGGTHCCWGSSKRS